MTTPDEIQNELLQYVHSFLAREDWTDDDLDAIESGLAFALASCVSSRSIVQLSDEQDEDLAEGAIEGVYSVLNAIAERN